jgi:hypothetical protein
LLCGLEPDKLLVFFWRRCRRKGRRAFAPAHGKNATTLVPRLIASKHPQRRAQPLSLVLSLIRRKKTKPKPSFFSIMKVALFIRLALAALPEKIRHEILLLRRDKVEEKGFGFARGRTVA